MRKSLMLNSSFGEKSKIYLSEPYKPSYLSFLRIFAAINAVLGILASCAFVFQLIQNSNRSSLEPPSYGWIVALAIALDGFLTFGLLNAVADIAENMIEVGTYVRDLKKQNNN